MVDLGIPKFIPEVSALMFIEKLAPTQDNSCAS